ncbi:amidohydrolase family protein, partial [Nocardia lijiangensis]|uniref:amidohydrolase family protein n=1 Tax=Nocardia lijiangensis TaxID=299618 RepID=UPI0012DD381B
MGTQLLIGGRFYSSSSPDATAMAVSDGMVVWLGAERPGRALHPDAEIIDLDGAFVAPAFVEPHVHVTALGLKLTGLDLSGARSLADCLSAVRDYAAARPDGAILGDGWDETRWPEGRPPTVEEIDAAAGPGRQVYLARVDAHSAAVSSALLNAVPEVTSTAGFTRGEPLRGAAHHLARAAVLGGLD